MSYEPTDEVRVRPRGWSRRVVGGLGCAAGLLVLVVAGLALAGGGPVSQPVRLANGETVTLEAVTVGTQPYVSGTPWQRVLHGLLPGSLKQRSGARTYQASDPRMVTFWVRRASVASPGQPASLQAMPFDEHGCTGPLVFGQGLGESLERYELRALPRRGERVGLRFGRTVDPSRPDSKWEVLGEISTPNPIPRPLPVWPPTRTPVTGTADRLSVQMLELKAGVDPGELNLNPGPEMVYWSARYRIFEDGKPTRAWSGSPSEMEDATGNQWYSGSVGYSEEPDVRVLHFTNPRWRDESSLKVGFSLYRTPEARFTPAETWSVKRIPIPTGDSVVTLGRSATVNGLPLGLVAIYGPQAKLPQNLPFGGGEGQVRLVMRGAGAPPPLCMEMVRRATDNTGREVRLQNTAMTSNGQERQMLYRVDAPAGATHFDLEYVVHYGKKVEMTVPITR
ncbi:MAG: hypothetical protein ACK47B_17690 [Armatimonadota bacterium]